MREAKPTADRLKALVDHMLYIIVNADDAGISHEVNEAIFDLMDGGCLRSTTLLANGPALDGALARIPTCPNCSFGVHLNLTQFYPLTKTPGLAPLLDREGRFNSDIIRRLRPSRSITQAICEEWCAQVDRIRDAGVAISHLDSHQHIHTCPAVFHALKKLQRRCGIRKVRATRNFYGPAVPPLTARARLKKAVWRLAMLSFPPRALMPDVFTSVRDFGATSTSPFWSGRPVIELMTHPGNPGSDDEVQYLRTDWLRGLDYPARLVGYNHVGQ